VAVVLARPADEPDVPAVLVGDHAPSVVLLFVGPAVAVEGLINTSMDCIGVIFGRVVTRSVYATRPVAWDWKESAATAPDGRADEVQASSDRAAKDALLFALDQHA
jgi:hypothetical protein